MSKLFKNKFKQRSRGQFYSDIPEPPIYIPWIIMREETEQAYRKSLAKLTKEGYTMLREVLDPGADCYAALLHKPTSGAK